jgi:hypothetical protein
MRSMILALGLALALGAPLAEAAKAKKKVAKVAKGKKKLPAQATQQTKLGIEQLMGQYKFGMTSSKVLAMLEKDVNAENYPLIKATSDPMQQDRLRRELMDKLKDLKKSYIQFTGKQSPWDISMVDREFAHKNQESMAVVWTKKDRHFFFFHNDKLYKRYIAFNAELFQGSTFEDFAKKMEDRFGPAERKYTSTLKGEKVMDHLAWPPSGNTLLRAIDNTKLYGNFCLVLVDKDEQENVTAGRRVNSPSKKYNDPLVDAVTKDGGEGGDSEEDVVDRITRRTSKSPPVSDTAASPTPTTKKKPGGLPDRDDTPPPPKKQKKVNAKNPLDGLDI